MSNIYMYRYNIYIYIEYTCQLYNDIYLYIYRNMLCTNIDQKLIRKNIMFKLFRPPH